MMYYCLLWKGLIKVRAWSIGLIGLLSPLLCASLWSWGTYHLGQKGSAGPMKRPLERDYQAVLCNACQMETFSALLALCAGNSPVASKFPAQRPVTWSFNVFFDLHLNKQLSKQSWSWWYEMPSIPLRRHCNDNRNLNQGVLHLLSKFGGSSYNWWWPIAWTHSKWDKFLLLSSIWPWRLKLIAPKTIGTLPSCFAPLVQIWWS